MKHIGLVSTGVLGGLAAATVFLCAVPDRGEASRRDAESGRGKVSHAVLVAESAEFGTRANRHAFDAQRIGTGIRADQNASKGAGKAAGKADAGSAEEDLGWDYVQLRL